MHNAYFAAGSHIYRLAIERSTTPAEYAGARWRYNFRTLNGSPQPLLFAGDDYEAGSHHETEPTLGQAASLLWFLTLPVEQWGEGHELTPKQREWLGLPDRAELNLLADKLESYMRPLSDNPHTIWRLEVCHKHV